ncbi:MAG: hypothetical protein WBR17_10585 [Paraburkholderia sp.]|uniref:hypothetical protein n=1 Tax=Paraburkholderia sp. TaxID=1926495 RepID=UPI003C605245
MQTYGAAYIQLIYTFYLPPRWFMWQVTGFMQEFRVVVGLDIAAPRFGQMGDLFTPVELRVQQRCKQLAARLARGEAVTVIVDSTGTNRSTAETPRARPSARRLRCNRCIEIFWRSANRSKTFRPTMF